MKTSRLIILNIVLALVIVAAGIGGYYYYYQQSNYVKTDDARVEGELTPLVSEVPGKLDSWKAKEGTTFKKGDVIGKIKTAEGQTLEIKAPADGTVIQDKAQKGQMVTPGQPMGNLVDLNNLYILSNIEETDYQDVKKGADVKIKVDAAPDLTIEGKVKQRGLATASTFSMMPQQNSSGDYTKVVQRIPVKISMDSYPDNLVPGMNATIEISK
ncbi:multidrug resistance efflux pump [Kroppenstedtia sanguinis]|uniref:Efflux RND transporter periplasmic adaptor subunit n=1 Tax=Kroppenstedtia sanguinis TaxID=1380684 RepID=A0ABW4CBA4_9BACL